LEFEISERLLIRDVESTLRVLSRLKSLGIGIAIDDFGTGYSSLATLQRFPLNTIKIDRSLVAGLCAGAQNMEFAESVIAMGKTGRFRPRNSRSCCSPTTRTTRSNLNRDPHEQQKKSSGCPYRACALRTHGGGRRGDG
jgi:hypothetical protein